MIVLDTNVLSELIRPTPLPRVVRWVDEQEGAELVITSITAAELRAGVGLLPRGRRKDTITTEVERLISDVFGGYVLPFDADSSSHYADIVARVRRRGRAMSSLDIQIAAICRQQGATLATRNITDFEAVTLPIVDPWSEPED